MKDRKVERKSDNTLSVILSDVTRYANTTTTERPLPVSQYTNTRFDVLGSAFT
jgi:hypothetical protein